jgi:glyoxylase-like metal-dependent hydrolase (beta-lactamase superfamily II)
MSSTAGSGVEVIAIDTPALGDRSYLAHDGEAALVVDPQRDIDRVLALAAARGVRITHVFETHIHNDYVTGGLALTLATGAAYHVNAADPVAYDRVPVSDGQVIEVSPVMRARVLATPGHTFTHLSYALEAAGHVHAVFTGGSLLYGSTGRPDLLGAAHADERVGAPDGGRAARRHGRVSHPRLWQLLLGDPVRGQCVDHRPRAARQPGADPGRGAVRARTARRAGRLPRLLRAHGPGQRGRPGRARPFAAP